MIKVNLLKEQTVRTNKKVSTTMPTVSRTGIIYAAVLVIVAGGLGVYWNNLNNKIELGENELKDLRKEEDRLKSMRQELEKLEALRTQRQNRINVIERLKESQKGPVSLLNAVIQAIPSKGNLWLTQLEQKDSGIKVLGATSNPEVIPDLMNNLTESGMFSSVDIELLERKDDSSSFSILCISKRTTPAE